MVVGRVGRAVLAVGRGAVGRGAERPAEVAHRGAARVVGQRRDLRVVGGVEQGLLRVVQGVGDRHRRDAGRGGAAGPVIAGAERAAVPVVARRAEHRVEQADVAVAARQLDRVVVPAGVVRRAVRPGRLARAVAEIPRAELVAVLAIAAGGEHRAPEALRVERRPGAGSGTGSTSLVVVVVVIDQPTRTSSMVEVERHARRPASLVGGQAHPEVRVAEVVPTPGVRPPALVARCCSRARSRRSRLLVPRFPVGTAVDHVVPASHDSWTPIVELLQPAETGTRPRGGPRCP